MKAIKFLRAVIVLFGLVLSACAPAAVSTSPANVGSGKPVSEVVFTGVIESINGDQWVINGQTVTVDSSVVRDGSFKVGDTIKVEASVAADGSVVAQRVETPSADDLAQMDDNSADGTPSAIDDNSNADNSNSDNSNSSVPMPGSTPQPLTFDDSGTEATGTVDAISDTSITIGGQTFTLAPGAEVKGVIVPGALVKLHFTVNADGTLSVTEIEITDPSQIGDDNSNDDNSNDGNSNSDDVNDDNGNDSNSNDDHGNDSNSNDDHGNDSNSNDDHGNDNGSSNNNGNDD